MILSQQCNNYGNVAKSRTDSLNEPVVQSRNLPDSGKSGKTSASYS
jgi:hypothetical protein